MKRVDLVGLGLNATDTLISVPRIPEPGSKANVRSIRVMPGGQAATAVVACATWGLSARYVGKVGHDAAANAHRDAFAAVGVETQITLVPGCSSAQSHIVIDDSGERAVLWHRDPRLAIRPDELRREWIVNARALLVDGCDTDAAKLAAKWAREAGVPVIADFDAAYSGIEALLPYVDYLIVSRDFPETMTGKADLKVALQELQCRFPARLTAATLGAGGVLAWNGEQFHYAPAYKIEAVDTTGAGDLFHAGFIYGLLQGWELQHRFEFACAAAALNCTAQGARGKIASREQIDALMKKNLRNPAAY